MLDAIFVARSGMLGHERGLNVISNNVTNMNTVGFRGSTMRFADVFIGSAPNGLQNGLAGGQRGLAGGLDASRTQVDFRSGQAQTTGRELDLALNGDGFFVVQDEHGEIRYTRAGDFDVVDDEVVVRGQKIKVMTRNAGGELVPLTLQGLKVSAAKATTKVTFNGNLSPDDTEKTIESLAVFDKQGGKHTLRLTFTKDTSTPPQVPGATTSWKVTLFEGTDEIGSGFLGFIQILPVNSPLTLRLALKDADAADVSFDFDGVTGSAFGTSIESTIQVEEQDGLATGTITGKTFDDQGVLKITYSNGETADGPKLALAQISDVNGLVQEGNALFAYRGSQAVTLREAGDDLQVQSRALERSNVSLTAEFSELILMQRGYQASSQVMSTANDMLQSLLDLRGRR